MVQPGPGLGGQAGGALAAGALTASCSGPGNCARRVCTVALLSICEALFSVSPVTANSSMPSRQSAELIQCQVCRVLSQ